MQTRGIWGNLGKTTEQGSTWSKETHSNDRGLDNEQRVSQTINTQKSTRRMETVGNTVDTN